MENEAYLCQERRSEGIVAKCKTAARHQSRVQLISCSRGHADGKRVWALADFVEKHEVVLRVARQASHMSVLLLPSQAFETCLVIPTIRWSMNEGIGLLVRGCSCDVHRWARLATAVAARDWKICLLLVLVSCHRSPRFRDCQRIDSQLSQGCQVGFLSLKPSNSPSVMVNDSKLPSVKGVKWPSPGIYPRISGRRADLFYNDIYTRINSFIR